MPHHDEGLDGRIAAWRAQQRRRDVPAPDVQSLEAALRKDAGALAGAGLNADEAFLLAVRRLGARDAASREVALAQCARAWEPAAGEGAGWTAAPRELVVVLALAVAAAAAVKAPELFGQPPIGAGGLFENGRFHFPNLAFFVLPFVAGYFAWKRRLGRAACARLAAGFAAAALVINLPPFAPTGDTRILAALHLPVVLWFVVGMAYAADRWRTTDGRMDFVRFSGELFIWYVLMALGGGVLTAFTAGIFGAIGLDLESLVEAWIVPCGALGAFVVGAWLVESRQGVIGNIAPVLTRVFTPLFALVLLAFLATMAVTGRGIDVEREVLIGFDLLLVLVLGLLLYAVSARDPDAPPGLFDAISVVLLAAALAADVVALAAIAARIGEFGLTPNRVAGLGLNLVLLVNLAWSFWLYRRFLHGRGPFAAVEHWQTAYLPVYAAWAALVVVLLPPLFGYA